MLGIAVRFRTETRGPLADAAGWQDTAWGRVECRDS